MEDLYWFMLLETSFQGQLDLLLWTGGEIEPMMEEACDRDCLSHGIQEKEEMRNGQGKMYPPMACL